MRLLRIVLPVLMLLLLPLVSCKDRQQTKAKMKVFAMVPKGVHLYYEPCFQGFKDAGTKLGMEAQYRASPQFELPKQVEIIENLIAQHVDGIAISALDDQGLTDVIAQATDAGIKVVTFDAPAPSSKALCYIGTMNDAAGYAGGVKMAELMNGKGTIALLQGGLGEANLNQRYEGFVRALADKAPAIKIVGREDTQTRMEKAVNKTEALLQAHPDVGGVFCISGEGIPGAASVLKEQNLGGKIVLGGFDDLPDSIAAIRNGSAKFCIAQKTYKMGYIAMEQLVDAVNGKTLGKQIDTGVQIVDLQNIDNYMQQMKSEFSTTSAAMSPATSPALK